MKKLLSLTVLIVLATISVSQAQELRKGYIGMDVGPAFLTGNMKEFCNTGVQYNSNFGYLFSKNIGITLTLYGTSFPVNTNTIESIGLSGVMVGPLFSTATKSEKFEFDFKPLIGFARGMIFSGYESAHSNITFTAGAEATIRWNCWSRIGFAVGANYYYGKPEHIDLSSFAPTFGVNYRLY